MSSAHNRPPLEVIPGESKRDKKRREWVEKVQVKHLDRLDNRDQMYIETHHSLSQLASSLLPLPPTSQSYLLSLYTLTLERDALLSQAQMHADYRMQSCERQHELEKEQLEGEFGKARNGVKSTLLERIEERRKRLREERDAVDVVDSHAFPAIPPGPLLQLPSTLTATSPSTSSSTSGGVNRTLRPSRHSRGVSYRSSTPAGVSSNPLDPTSNPSSSSGNPSQQTEDRSNPLSILSEEIFAPSQSLSLSILNHPSLSKTSLAANLLSFAQPSTSSTKKARHATSSSAAQSSGGENANGGPTMPGQGIFDRPSADSSKDTDRIFVYTPGKSLADLGKVVKSSEMEIDWDLDQLRRTWKGGVLMGSVRGRRGAAVRAEALTAAGAGR